MKALEESEKNPMTSSTVKYRDQRDICIHLLKKELKLSYRKLSEFLLDYGFDISYRQLRSICSKFGDKDTEDDEKDFKKDLKKEKNGETEENDEESDDLEGKEA